MMDPETDSNRWTSRTTVQALLLIFGLMIGWKIGGDRMRAAALEWAVSTAQECETAYDPAEIVSVSSCLQEEIDHIDNERKEEARAADHDPRR